MTFPGIFDDIPRNVWRHSSECLATLPGMFYNIPEMFYNIPRNVWGQSPEYLRTFPVIFGDIPWNVWRHSPECLRRFPGMFGDIPRNVWGCSPEYNIPPIPRVPRIPFPIPVFLFLYIALNQLGHIHSLLFAFGADEAFLDKFLWLHKEIRNANTYF